ncbi:uncharacterized protein PV09_06460 [Verruconis gallopava]|uniref:Uncharacterized protein n=1 Tax=Verruconis gallopava TaxID=253628 RepID=A0A0D2A6E0_9PEZI|nr:uncharacterized protein PV09_06460 [Verruconis gallopava]KIW02313.1 hypothetical protein PV09_06460 [Verruconis gallopava]
MDARVADAEGRARAEARARINTEAPAPAPAHTLHTHTHRQSTRHKYEMMLRPAVLRGSAPSGGLSQGACDGIQRRVALLCLSASKGDDEDADDSGRDEKEEDDDDGRTMQRSKKARQPTKKKPSQVAKRRLEAPVRVVSGPISNPTAGHDEDHLLERAQRSPRAASSDGSGVKIS